ncbi:biotin synthase [Limnohabitans sp. Jir72]|uniref:biotin synthase n=1 Tax=Limnohabitans sp. Jir72 TaxID=1977909 RepID=UPI000D3943EA|nr:biotin synthase [Limnohabitans sp. Jir72]PUE34006.1 biotin synthase [Limnohabitans sp. Jir72]
MSAPERPPSLDPVAALRWAAYPVAVAASPWLHEEVAARMQERLDFIKLQPRQWAHWEPLRGGLQAHKALQQRYSQADVWLSSARSAQADAAQKALKAAWWQPARWMGPRVQTGLPPEGSVQMVWANMQLHASAAPQDLLKSWHRALAVDGFLMFSCFGPDTLIELRALYARQGWPAPAHEFTDMHDWGDMLVQAGFAEPVMDMERITLTYETPGRLLTELRELGRNLHTQRFAGLRGRRWRQQLVDALMGLAKTEEGGCLSLSFEIVYGHALKPKPRAAVAAQTEIGLDQMRIMLRRSSDLSDKL